MQLKNKIIGIFIIILIPIGFIIEHYEKRTIYEKRQPIIKQLEQHNLNSIVLGKIDSLNALSIDQLKLGKEEILKHKIIIAGITRDNINDILVTVKHIETIGKTFKDYKVIIFENDSKDGTKEALAAWSKNNSKVKIISQDFNNTKRPSHKFMADARNYYLKAIESKEYDDFNMLMVMDMDMSFGIDLRGIEDSFSKINQWDAVCSNGILDSKGKMYDTFAFRNAESPFTPQKWQEICSKNDPNDKWSKKCNFNNYIIANLIGFRVGWQAENRLYWLKISPQIQKYYQVGSDLIPVSSCFGGMALYKREAIKGCFYDSIENDCEHVSFHECIREKHNGKMVMNPSQIIKYSHYKE
jgi:hypothetical protein